MAQGSHEASFLGLSLEIRNDIYSYVLQERESVKIDLIRRRDGTIELARQPKRRTKEHRHEVYDSEKRVWKPAPPGRAAVILVNRQIFFEASQILYAINCFKFDNMYDLADGITCLGERAKFLRYVEVSDRRLFSRMQNADM